MSLCRSWGHSFHFSHKGTSGCTLWIASARQCRVWAMEVTCFRLGNRQPVWNTAFLYEVWSVVTTISLCSWAPLVYSLCHAFTMNRPAVRFTTQEEMQVPKNKTAAQISCFVQLEVNSRVAHMCTMHSCVCECSKTISLLTPTNSWHSVRHHQSCLVWTLLFSPHRADLNLWLIQLVKGNISIHQCCREIIIKCQLTIIQTLLFSKSILTNHLFQKIAHFLTVSYFNEVVIPHDHTVLCWVNLHTS